MGEIETAAVVNLRAPRVPNLAFEAGSHTYRFNGDVVPSVTQLLKQIESWEFLDEEAKAFYSARGTAVHLATHLDDEGDLDESTVDTQIAGYVESWRKLRLSADIQVLSVEEQIYHPLLRYAGTLDRRIVINERHSVLDIKAGVKLPSHGVQTAGYRKAWNHGWAAADQIKDCYSAYLQNDGSQAKLVKWDDPLHEQMFTALLTQHYWKGKYAK